MQRLPHFHVSRRMLQTVRLSYPRRTPDHVQGQYGSQGKLRAELRITSSKSVPYLIDVKPTSGIPAGMAISGQIAYPVLVASLRPEFLDCWRCENHCTEPASNIQRWMLVINPNGLSCRLWGRALGKDMIYSRGRMPDQFLTRSRNEASQKTLRSVPSLDFPAR